ncbi:sigma-54 dependent transcriptional regulator [Frigidibacter sp. RF13]|uniref:sigma-54-dependent transcriptional regulator n=1 Tax=Frigidibacter sp. RF13 TaxID=2997340 RepID=UPI00226D4F8A|nr:sigma-54 dependent transcriptional regulator [Frigidibacter sp. RF13]MCY1126161.1 sigma-54 dependent transcriptional regulator [Frigidibacter sp. RF13]
MTFDRTILLIENTVSLQVTYASVLRQHGYRVITAGTAEAGLAALRETAPQAVIVDLALPDRDGIELMADILTERPGLPVIVITANGPTSTAVEAMRAGAHDFLVKPFDEQRFLNAVGNAIAAAEATLASAEAPDRTAPSPGDFVGSSATMTQVYARIRSVARSMAPVFITGESGTGKELCAEAIHRLSSRATKPFVILSCGTIPSDQLESELFGHMKGSFPGAIAERTGAAAAADGGTLFLDEICELDPSVQAKLLKFVQTSTIQPVGSNRPRKVNVRIICATNRDPAQAIRMGQLRQDLYYRLHVVPLHMPPLRDRGADVIEIAEQALARMSEEEGRRFRGLSDEAAALFRFYAWPGNVRELLNVIRQVVVMHDGREVTPAMLPPELTEAPVKPNLAGAPRPVASKVEIGAILGRPLAEAERMIIEATIAMHGGSITRAARVLEVAPSTLYRKIEAWQAKTGGAKDSEEG